jgi:hypothetical protein
LTSTGGWQPAERVVAAASVPPDRDGRALRQLPTVKEVGRRSARSAVTIPGDDVGF